MCYKAIHIFVITDTLQFCIIYIDMSRCHVMSNTQCVSCSLSHHILAYVVCQIYTHPITIYHIKPCSIIANQIVRYQIISCHIMPYHVISCHVVSNYIYIRSHKVMMYHITSSHIIFICWGIHGSIWLLLLRWLMMMVIVMLMMMAMAIIGRFLRPTHPQHAYYLGTLSTYCYLYF